MAAPVSEFSPLSREQLEIRDLVRTLAQERIGPRAAEIDATHEFPWDVVELFREHDLFALLFPEAYAVPGRERCSPSSRSRRSRRCVRPRA